jgi:hypothetical protein
MDRGRGRHKFAVILNREWPPADGLVFFALATSKVKHYESGFMQDSIVRIPGQRYPFLPLDTIVKLIEISTIDLQSLAEAANLEISGDLTADDIGNIDGVLSRSRVIDEVILSRIR